MAANMLGTSDFERLRDGWTMNTTASVNSYANFYSQDTEKNFKRNSKSQPLDWIWRRQRVEYRFNREGFRNNINFDQVKWRETIITMGCSFVLGEGVDQRQTLAAQLSRETGQPVLNMGVSGSSMSYSVFNLLQIISHYGYPKGVVMGWTAYTRWPVVHDLGWIAHEGIWSDDPFYREWSRNPENVKNWARHTAQTARILCEAAGSWFCEFTYFADTHELLDCKRFQSIDLARDGCHPGPESHKQAAEWVAKQWRGHVKRSVRS